MSAKSPTLFIPFIACSTASCDISVPTFAVPFAIAPVPKVRYVIGSSKMSKASPPANLPTFSPNPASFSCSPTIRSTKSEPILYLSLLDVKPPTIPSNKPFNALVSSSPSKAL